MGTILIADDDRTCRDSIVKALEREGYTVKSAPDVESALRAFESEPFDLVVSDYRMPAKSGLDFLVELRRRGSSVPFLLISAFAEYGAEQSARTMGVVDVLKKPFRRQQLLDWVHRFDGRKEDHDSRD